jgi:hypothetical protein
VAQAQQYIAGGGGSLSNFLKSRVGMPVSWIPPVNDKRATAGAATSSPASPTSREPRAVAEERERRVYARLGYKGDLGFRSAYRGV